jgi:hypothetical protein
MRRTGSNVVVFGLMLAVSAVVAVRAFADNHPCAGDAAAKAEALLRLHNELVKDGPVAVDPAVRLLPPVKALKGNGHFDVLELWGHVYKADFRLRFLYAQIKGSCALMGEEILEASDPY